MNENKQLFDKFLDNNSSLIEFCFLGGSIAKKQDNNNSDYDVFMCVKHIDKDILLHFNEFYFDLHRRYFRKPDLEYPGELMSYKILVSSIENCLNFKPTFSISNHVIYDGLVWSGMLTDNNSHFYGDSDKYKYIQKIAIKVINKWFNSLATNSNKKQDIKSKIQYLKQNVIFGKEEDEYKLIQIKKRASDYSKLLSKNKTKLQKLLLGFESYETFVDEYKKSVDALNNINIEFDQFPKANTRIVSSFLPLNLPLYSLVLFSLIPSLYSDHVFLRPPTILFELYSKIVEILNINNNAVSLCKEERNDFVIKYAKNSNVVVFVGKYENALNLAKSLYKETLFIYTGYGVNPILVLKNANINKAVEDTVNVKIFNNGQDCAGADAIIIPEKFKDIFIEKLIQKISKVPIGSYKNKKVRIGPILDNENLYDTAILLKKYKNNFIHGGIIDFKQKIINPTIILQSIDDMLCFEEFYSPIFKIITYNHYTDLGKFFNHTNYLQNKMYVSVYGNLKKSMEFLKENIILLNTTIHEHEKGNYEYGGFGKHANFVSINKNYYSKPILISREISNFLTCDDR